MEKTCEGETILRLLVRQNTFCAIYRFQFLVSHGLDPLVPDTHGQTALDIAEARQQEQEYADYILDWWKARAV